MSRIGVATKVIAVVCFSLLLWIGCASAATIVVSKTSPACTTGDDYYMSIQAAVDSANDGDEIVVCPGTYVENIIVDKSLTIRSMNGYYSTVVQAKNPDKDVFEVTADYVEISGFTVNGATKGGWWLISGIQLHYADYCNISNNNCSDNDNGIYANYSSNNIITDNICSNNRKGGIMLRNSSNTTIENNIIFNNNYGIFSISSFDNSIKNNDISSNRVRGIYLYHHSSNNIIRHNVVKSNYQGGIMLISSGYNTIEKNIVSSNNGVGISVSESDNNIIKNNTACENEFTGINLQDSSGNEISHNVVNNNVLGIESIYGSNNTITNNSVSCLFHSIKLEHSFNNIIRGNNITNNKWGILLHSHSFNNTLRNNVVKSNYFEGIELDSSSGNNTIVENIVSNNGDGFTVDSYGNIIKNNTVTSNDRVGIELLNSSYNIIKNNTANSNGEGGVLLSSNSSHNTVEVNTANSNDCFGIKLENSSYNIIKNNTAKSNNGEGIALYISNHNIITDNTANSNKRGIDLGGCIDEIDENAVIHGTGSHNNSIENNIASNNKEGINLLFSGNNTIKSNIASNNKEGINLGSSCNNAIKNNIVSSNRDGIHISLSDNNIVENNIASNNYGIAESGICLAFSAKNILKNNIVSSNEGNGIRLSGAYYNILWNNHISLNQFSGIRLLLTNNNAFYHNNIIDNTIQVKADGNSLNNYWYHTYLLEGNYWSDYKGTDVNGDGIGDTAIPHPGYPCVDIDYDIYPYMNKSGWLTFLVLPEYWDFGTVYQGEIVQKTFKMQNAFVYNNSRDDLNIISINSEPDVGISDVKPSIKIPKGYSKTFNATIDTTNLKGHILRSIEIRSDDILTPNKTVLIYGIVTPPRHEIRIKNVDFQSSAIRGQITLLNITIENRGDFREKNVSIEIKEEDKTRDSTMIEIIDPEEAKSAIVKWNTNNVSLGIHDVTIEVLNKDQNSLANITVTVTVLAPSQAKTLIVTNHERLEGIEDNLIRLSHHPSVNGIILDVGNDKRCSEAYNSFDSYHNSENANNVAQAIKDLTDATREVYQNIEYLLIVGNDEVIPFYRIQDKSLESYVGSYGLYDEKDYIETYEQLKRTTSVGSAFDENRFLTDDFYANFDSEDLPKGFEGVLYIPEIPIGRLVETPQEIRKTIDVFSKKGAIVEPIRIFITSYDFMNDAGRSCASVWSTLSTPVFMGKGIEEHGTYTDTAEIINELLNESNNIVAIFQHADHSGFDIAESHDFVTSNIISNSSADLDGSIVYTMSCHAGLNVPEDEKFNYDLAQAFMGKGVLAYVAPTGWGIGGVVTEAGHERLLHYFTKHLCEGMDAGTALMHAKQDYYAFDFDFDYIDQKVVLTSVLYGLPMYGVNVEAKTDGIMEAMSMETPCNTFTFRPDYSVIETPVGAYSSVDETLSSPGKPVLPKLIWPYLMDGKMLHGITLKNARYALIENTALPYEEYVVSIAGGYKQPLVTGETWNPSEFFKVSTIGKRQYIILITGQFKKTGWTIKEGQKVNIGDLRRYTELTFDLHLSAPADEKNPPEITVSYVNASCISVNATDESGIEKLVMAYTDNTGNWDSFDIVPDAVVCALEEEIELEVGKEYGSLVSRVVLKYN